MIAKYFTLRDANIARQREWDKDSKVTLSYRINELGGEAGELLNLIKKIQREKLAMVGSRASKNDIMDEVGDLVVCSDLVGMQFDVGVQLLRNHVENLHLSPTQMGAKLMMLIGRIGECGIDDNEMFNDRMKRDVVNWHLARLIDWAHSFAHVNGFGLLVATQDKFNKTSVKYGLDTRLEFAR